MAKDGIDQKVAKPIFVVGCGRSGTTLLFDLLKKHPQLAPTTGAPDGEDHVGWVKYGECLMSGLGNQVTSPGVMGYHYCLYMDEKDVTPEVIESMTRYYWKEVLQSDPSRRVVNKNPHISNKLRYVRAIFPDAKFVHIIRDCLPMISSWIKVMADQKDLALYWPSEEFPCLWVFDAPQEKDRATLFKDEDRFFPGGGTMRLADYWSIVNRNIPVQLWDTPDQLLTVKYEDLVAQPSETLAQVCDFCELERFTEIPVRIHPDTNEKYKSELTGEQAAGFLARTQTTRNLFGYPELGQEKRNKAEEAVGKIVELSAPFQHGGGYAWVATLENLGIVGGDTEGNPRRSPLRLFEDEDELRPSHTLHDMIRTVGLGASSHWGNTLYFSTSDNSDPNTNTRRYRVYVPSDRVIR